MPTPVELYLKAVERELHIGKTTEHTHRPALKQLVESLQSKVNATNEPTRVACGAPDFVVTRNPGNLTIGYIETKDIAKSLDEAEDSEQLNRYRRSLANLILTDYLEFRWYVDGERRNVVRLGRVGKNNRVILEDDGEAKLRGFMLEFLQHKPEPIINPKQLAQRLARLTHIIRDTIIEAFENKSESQLLQDLRQAFAMRLLPDLEQDSKTPEFADMYAQTIAYGLFAARCNHKGPEPFRRPGSASEIPRTNPFLRKLFETITGTELDDEPYAGFLDDLVQVLDVADVKKILAHFGTRTKQEDPVVHFYETFLATYDPKLREARGVFYTPEPVVSYIVRSTDALLRDRFALPEGLSDTAIVKYKVKGRKKGDADRQSHRVLILDPACGTGTFLYAVVDHIRNEFETANNAGMWSAYVRNHLLPRIYGFELLMAPYAVAHLKLGLQLAAQDMPPSEQKRWAYDFSGNERLGVYLTNTLEKVEPEVMPLLAHLRVITEEANAAAEIKRDLPIMVIIGNPPYSNFGMMNKGEWISGLMDDWKPPEEKKWNPDDFMKFIRWAQWRIEQTGAGILGFITRNTYLDGITHWKMRESLMKTFSEIYVLDLHGSLRAKEKTPNGDPDKNVFDIQWGVSIGLFIKDPNASGDAKVRHADLWGEREDKYHYLSGQDVTTTKWTKVKPTAPNFYFAPRDTEGEAEYLDATALLDIFKLKNSGLQTKKDSLTIHHTEADLKAVLKDVRAESVETLRKKYNLGPDGRDWAVASAKDDVIGSNGKIFKIEYRPFDTRFSDYTAKRRGSSRTPALTLPRICCVPTLP
jgi:Type ISP C-terminal specificity domain/N-6 DNA Methylase